MPVFLLDENVHRPDYIIRRCAEVRIEVLRVHELGMDNTDDGIILETAIQAEYVLVTGDIKGFRKHTLRRMQERKPFSGVILLQRTKYRNVEAIIRKIQEVAANYDNDQTREWWLT
jgi:predicted nuclease of predicted toxin-antitoxin system